MTESLQWPAIELFLVRGRCGTSFPEIAAEFGLSVDAAETLWRAHSSLIDRERREWALAAIAAEPTAILCGSMSSAETKRLIELARSGIDFADIGKAMRLGRDTARKRWQKYASQDDREVRSHAVRIRLADPNRPRAKRRSYGASKKEDGPLRFEPAVPRPIREFDASCVFADDPAAERDKGSAGRMPARETWALGGTSLADVIGDATPT